MAADSSIERHASLQPKPDERRLLLDIRRKTVEVEYRNPRAEIRQDQHHVLAFPRRLRPRSVRTAREKSSESITFSFSGETESVPLLSG